MLAFSKIRRFKLSAFLLIFFIFKGYNRNLKLYVNYRKLNRIIIFNRYLFPFTKKL